MAGWDSLFARSVFGASFAPEAKRCPAHHRPNTNTISMSFFITFLLLVEKYHACLTAVNENGYR